MQSDTWISSDDGPYDLESMFEDPDPGTAIEPGWDNEDSDTSGESGPGWSGEESDTSIESDSECTKTSGDSGEVVALESCASWESISLPVRPLPPRPADESRNRLQPNHRYPTPPPEPEVEREDPETYTESGSSNIPGDVVDSESFLPWQSTSPNAPLALWPLAPSRPSDESRNCLQASRSLSVLPLPEVKRDDPVFTPSFPQFKKLPPEIRNMIWKAALPGPRIADIRLDRLKKTRLQWEWEQLGRYPRSYPFLF